ncbi:MAG TPA: ABC transporter ATP-binding protein [Cellvibrionales bacterium]|jgi:ATP-binding cassette subfamily B protein|nr:ABC transporter ATP-binding protein [Cellvibrionales bacterium]HAW14960.1 ABC transporter ATP-binding protein [Cellvibrionales bacterium]HCX27059.1 ABC transporter ATP-binding protein [Cellvibrionales bacterium]
MSAVNVESVDGAESKNETAAAPKKLSSLFHLLSYLKPYKWRWITAMAALLFTASLTLLMGQGVKLLIDSGFGEGSLALLNQAVLVLLALAFLMSLGTFTRFYLVSWLGERVSADIRTAVFNHIVNLHPSYFETNRSGEITSRLTTDTTLLQTIIGSSFSLALRSSLTTVGALIMLFITNAKLMIIVVGCVPLVMLPMLFYGKKVKRLSRASQDSIANVGSYAGEIIQNIKAVQSYTQEQQEKKVFGSHVEEAFGIAKSRVTQRAFLMSAVILMVFSALSVMLWVGGSDVINGSMTAGDLAAFIFYALMVAMGVATVSEVFGDLQRAAGATERLVELLQVKSLIAEPLIAADAKSLPAELAFKQVSFNYPSRPDEPALKSFSLVLPEGQCLALVGPSGAGKSTVFELIQRFYDPQSGLVTLGNKDIRELSPQALRQQLAVVAQQPTLFTTDVASNIRYGRPDATDEEVIEAAKAAYAHEFISQLPNGYNSFLGEQGVRLSGGQKQRIAIARAILKDPRILMLDEATSALDTESEFKVQKALERLMENRTTLIIAHRLSTILHADTIAVLDHGELVAQGAHEHLLKESALYAKLASYQFKEQSA